MISSVNFGTILPDHSSGENLRLPLIEDPESKKRNRVASGFREECDEEKSDKDGEDALELGWLEVMFIVERMKAYYEEPLPTTQSTNASHMKTKPSQI